MEVFIPVKHPESIELVSLSPRATNELRPPLGEEKGKSSRDELPCLQMQVSGTSHSPREIGTRWEGQKCVDQLSMLKDKLRSGTAREDGSWGGH